MKTSQDLFKQLDEAESLFSKGSIKAAQKKVREVISKSKELDKIPNKLRHKINFAIGQSRYFDDMSSFATNPKREELIKEISTIIQSPLESPKKQAHLIHDVQTKWQLLDLSSRPASKEQWNKFNELTNKAWEPCSEYFDELKQIKVIGKRNKERIIPLLDIVLELIYLYKEKRAELQQVNSDMLILSKKGNKLSESFVYRLINEYFSTVSQKTKKR